MSEYPQHDKLSALNGENNTVGEFVEWLQGQGVNLMVWRTDLTDMRECYGDRSRFTSMTCDEYADSYAPDSYLCAKCANTGRREIGGLKAWTHDARTIPQLLADFFEIDYAELEREKRSMLKAIRAAS